MESKFLNSHPRIKDILNFGLFILLVTVGTILINTFVFRSFSVLGPSMETTFFTGDRLIANRLPITLAQIQNKDYVPNRGEIIVFKNPRFVDGEPDEYIVKRAIAFPGERVTVTSGVLKIYNDEHPEGYEPDSTFPGPGKPGSPSSGEVDMVVPDGTVFVAGDHRRGSCSYDSRSGLGTIPYFDIIGPLGLRIWPLPGIGADRSSESADRATSCEASF
jgi:signal peptidase I